MSIRNDGSRRLPRDDYGWPIPAVYDESAGVMRAVRGTSTGTTEAAASNIQTNDADISSSNPLSMASADGSNVTFGAKADSAATNDSGTFTYIAFTKRLLARITTLIAQIPVVGQSLMASSLPVTLASNQTDIGTALNTIAGSVSTSIATAISSALVANLPSEQAWSKNNITTNTGTTVKSGAGTLKSIVINTLGGTSTITVYDNTSAAGTKIATINSALTMLPLTYEVAFTIGLHVVTAGISAADITVIYK